MLEQYLEQKEMSIFKFKRKNNMNQPLFLSNFKFSFEEENFKQKSTKYEKISKFKSFSETQI